MKLKLKLFKIKRKKRKTYREDEAVSSLEDLHEERSPPPHHLYELRRHVDLLSGKAVSAVQPVAVEAAEPAPLVRGGVHGRHQEVAEERPCPVPRPKPLEEEVEHGRILVLVRLHVGFVDHGDDHRLPRHRRPLQCQLQLVLAHRFLLIKKHILKH